MITEIIGVNKEEFYYKISTDLQHAQEVGQRRCSQLTECQGALRFPMHPPDWMLAALQTWATLSNRSATA